MLERNKEKINREVRISLSLIPRMSDDAELVDLARLEVNLRGIHLKRLINVLYARGFSLHPNLSPNYPEYAENEHYRALCERILTGLHTVRELPYDLIKKTFRPRYACMGLS